MSPPASESAMVSKLSAGSSHSPRTFGRMGPRGSDCSRNSGPEDGITFWPGIIDDLQLKTEIKTLKIDDVPDGQGMSCMIGFSHTLRSCAL